MKTATDESASNHGRLYNSIYYTDVHGLTNRCDDNKCEAVRRPMSWQLIQTSPMYTGTN